MIRAATAMRAALSVAFAVAVGGLSACPSDAGPGEPDPPTIAVAASLRPVMPALIEAWGAAATVTYGASGTLRRQVETGAPIDAVVFASAAPVDSLIEQGLADPATRSRVATNQLVLIRPADTPSTWTWKTLESLGPDDKLAIGEPAAVPAGAYAKEALQGLGTWEGLQDRVVLAGDVTMVLAYARRGEVAAAAVYSTDARAFDDVVVLDRADWEGAPAPEVIGAATTSSSAGRSLLAFLDTPAARAVFAEHGFGPP